MILSPTIAMNNGDFFEGDRIGELTERIINKLARRILEKENPTMEEADYSAFLLNEALKLRQRYLGSWMPGERILADELSDECKEQQGGENEGT